MKRLLPGVLALLALLLFDLRVLANHDWDPHVFVFERPADLPADRPCGGGMGYDGQFAYAIARPFAVAWWAPSALVLALAPGML